MITDRLVSVMMQLWFLLVFCCLLVVQGRERLDPLVETPQGLIRGLRADDGDYSMFLGVPFAKVDPNNPFGNAYPYPKFEEIFEAYDDSARCPQVDEFSKEIVGTLDCLEMNIFVPNKASTSNKLAVLVSIYGGGFEYGYGNRFVYGPKFFVRHDVILVSINYRVGPYGFFCLETPEVPGNQGIKDQVMALRWIKENIASFGGDIDRITIMGESAGSMSVECHLYSDKENLFSRAILQSGSIISPIVIKENDPSRPLRIAAHLGLVTQDLTEALDFLAKTDTNLVIAASKDLNIEYRLCVEKAFEGVDSIFTDHPLNMDIPNVRNVALMAGFTTHERMNVYVDRSPEFYENLNVINEHLTMAFDYDEQFVQMEDLVRHFYLGDEAEGEETRFAVSDFESDFVFSYPTQKSIRKYIENGGTKVYQYLFSYSGGRNYFKKKTNVTEYGAVHADELSFLFDMSFEQDPISEGDQRMIDQLTTLWANFGKYGDPTPETTELLPVKWTPVTADTIDYLDIGDKLEMGRSPFHDRFAFWDLFFLINEGKWKKHIPKTERDIK